MEAKQLDLFNSQDWALYDIINNTFPNNENSELEYKAALGGFPTDFWKTYSAFANTNGGFIVLGVSEKKAILKIEGVPEDKLSQLQKHFWDNINNPNTTNANLLTNEDVQVVEVKNKSLLVFRVPIASRTQKPVYLTHNPFGNTYKRNHEGDYKCTNEEVRRMLADADTTLQHDCRILEGYSIEDIDLNSLKKYRQLFSVAKPSHPWLTLDDIEFMEKLGGYRKDRVSKKIGFTLAGVLMFGKESSIVDQECVPNFFPDFREIHTNDTSIRWTDRIYPDGTWEANLFQFYLKIWPRLSSSLPKPFQLRDGVRQDETPAHTALREAFVNALIHTDYTAQGNIIITHKMDSYSFSNPGTLLVSLQQYYHGGISECRNPSLQKMFLMIGSAEKAGSGVDKIMLGWEYAHWRRPYLKIIQQPDRLELELPMFSNIPKDTLVKLKSIFGESIDSLGKDELNILSTCEIEGEVSNTRLQYMIDLHRADITKILQELCKEGYLLSDSKGRWTTYHLNTQFLELKMDISVDIVDTSENNVDTSANNVATSANNRDTSENNRDTSVNNRDTSDNNVDTFDNNRNTSENNRDTLTSFEKRSWVKKEVMENIILNICKSEYKTLEELAISIDRNPKYVKNNIIPKLIDSGRLERLYPTKINHPHQAYKTKE